MSTRCLRGFALMLVVLLPALGVSCKRQEKADTAGTPGEATEVPGAPAEAERRVTDTDALEAARKLGTPTDAPVVTTESGLQYIDVKAGDGVEAKAGDNVSVHYTGWLVNGSKFDSSVDRGQPFVFPLGAGRVIKGWDEGVAGMKVGGARKLIIPPDLGYGSRGTGPIPPGSTLIFEVELLEVR